MTIPVPDVSAPPWAMGLHLLVGTLTVEMHGQPSNTWACRSHHGRQISLTRQEDGRRALRISRADRPARGDIRAWDKWEEDIQLLKQHMGVASWEPLRVSDRSEVRWYIEPMVTK